MSNKNTTKTRFATLCIQSEQHTTAQECMFGPIVPPIVMSSAFKRGHNSRTVFGLEQSQKLNKISSGEKTPRSLSVESKRSYDLIDEFVNHKSKQDSLGYYNDEGNNETAELNSNDNCQANRINKFPFGRYANPTRTSLEKCLAKLENGQFSITLSSGNAALTVLSSLLNSGDHVIIIDEVYIDTRRFWENCAKRINITSTFVNMNNINETVDALKPQTKMVWIETPTNPSLRIVDIKAIVDGIKIKQPNVIVIVDSTLSTPVFQRPLELGADIVLHSLSKYINGHNDVVMGALITNNQKLFNQMKMCQEALGVAASSFDCFLVSRSIKTLPLRMRQHQKSAMKLARALEDNSNILKVFYPGLTSHPQYDLYEKQMMGSSGILSIRVKGSAQEIEIFLDSLKHVQCADSVGGFATLIQQPDRERTERELDSFYGENFFRVSVGLEDVNDIIDDFLQALKKMNL